MSTNSVIATGGGIVVEVVVEVVVLVVVVVVDVVVGVVVVDVVSLIGTAVLPAEADSPEHAASSSASATRARRPRAVIAKILRPPQVNRTLRTALRRSWAGWY
jgi:hypothetical protein